MKRALLAIVILGLALVSFAGSVGAQTTPEPVVTAFGDWVASVEARLDDLEARVAALEVEPSPLPSPTTEPSPSPSPSPEPSPSPSPTPLSKVDSCLTRASLDVISDGSTPYDRASFPADHTFDARLRYDTTYPAKDIWPVDVGRSSGGANACIIGGIYVGQQPRTLTWQESKDIGGSAVRLEVQGQGAYIAGHQADNHHDGIFIRTNDPSDPTGGDGWLIEHSYITYNRDDCLENDELTSGTIRDVLWDGCFVGISADDVHGVAQDQSGERIVLQNALIRLQQMPSSTTARGVDHGDLFKWDSFAPRVTIRDSVILVEHNGAGEWPSGTLAENVTVVFDSYGTLSLDPIPGVTVTSDMAAWTNARQDWLDRHGCTSFGNCSQLLNPTE